MESDKDRLEPATRPPVSVHGRAWPSASLLVRFIFVLFCEPIVAVFNYVFNGSRFLLHFFDRDILGPYPPDTVSHRQANMPPAPLCRPARRGLGSDRVIRVLYAAFP